MPTKEDWTLITHKCNKISYQMQEDGKSPVKIQVCMELYVAGDRSKELYDKMRSLCG